MKLILLIDVSGSMKGHKIGAVDDAIDNLTEELRDYSSSHEGVSISILLFSKTAMWMQEDMDIEEFDWNRPECNGMTSLGAACKALHDKLDKNPSFEYRIILMSDGCPTDDYDEGIEILDRSKSFTDSIRYAIAIGEDADIPSLVRFTADKDKVLKVSDLSDLTSLLTQAIELPIESTPVHIDQPSSMEESDEWD